MSGVEYDVVVSRHPVHEGRKTVSIVGVRDSDITLFGGEFEEEAIRAVRAYLRHHRLPRPSKINFL